MPKIKVNDIAMYYEIHGKGDPIVFIPGFSSDHLIWNPTIKFFKDQYQVILLDNRGSGWAHEINAPTLVIAGDEDLIFLKDSVKALANIIPNSTFHSFKECGHIPAIEFPEEFFDKVNNYIHAL